MKIISEWPVKPLLRQGLLLYRNRKFGAVFHPKMVVFHNIGPVDFPEKIQLKWIK